MTFLYQLVYFFLGGGVRGFVLSYCFCFVSSMFCWYLCSFVSYWCCVLALQLPLVLLSLHVNRYILNRFLVNKTNRCTEFQFYWYYDSTCFGQPFCPSSGVLSRTSAVVHFMQLWWPFATRSRMELLFHPTPGSKRSSQLHKMYQRRCTAKNSWWWAERLPETCRIVIPIKLEFSSSVGFIHKESVTMHGHTIVKYWTELIIIIIINYRITKEVTRQYSVRTDLITN